jgi:hypothetical protein
MSTIDRRAFVVGCLAVPLAGCQNPNRASVAGGSSSLPQPRFLNPVQPSPTGATPVFVVTGPIPS